MHKKTTINDLDIPNDDIDCWDRYPKHRWVFDLSRLLDTQGVHWSPFKSEILTQRVLNMEFHTSKELDYTPAYIYTEPFNSNRFISELYIVKGEIKLSRYFDKNNLTQLEDNIGNMDLRANAFVSMHFQKFTGVISLEFANNIIISVKLRPQSELGIVSTNDIVKLNKRIYKKHDLLFSGPTDQVIREILTS